MVKPHNGPSAVLVLNATCHNAVQDASGFSHFGLNGFSKWFSSGLAGGNSIMGEYKFQETQNIVETSHNGPSASALCNIRINKNFVSGDRRVLCKYRSIGFSMKC